MVRDPVVQVRILQRGRRGGLARAFRLAVEYAVAQHGEHGQYDQGDEDAVDYLFGLLFLLGLEVGCNEDITGNFHHLGVASLIIASGATAGSVLCSVWLWHRVRRNGTKIAAKDGRG